MVTSGAARQCSRSQEKKRRMEVDTPYFLKSRFNAGCCKAIFCYTALLLHCFATLPLYSVDFGTHGTIFPIEEEDPIVLIQQKLKSLDENGELKKHQQSLQKKTKDAVERSKPVEGITKATQDRIFFFDPSYVVDRDLMDHTGNVFAKAGTKINPLKTVSLSHTLLFFDGDDEEQKIWVKEQLDKGLKPSLRLILIKGAPLELAQEWNQAVYFDQGGTLTKKLGIQYVPALVTQEGLRLRIEETTLSFTVERPSYQKSSQPNKKEVLLEKAKLRKTKVKKVSKGSCLERSCSTQDKEKIS